MIPSPTPLPKASESWQEKSTVAQQMDPISCSSPWSLSTFPLLQSPEKNCSLVTRSHFRALSRACEEGGEEQAYAALSNLMGLGGGHPQ